MTATLNPRLDPTIVHELAITQQIVELVVERVRGVHVRRVVVQIGKLSAVLPEAVRFCFDVAARGTPLEGAELVIDEPSGQVRCRACGIEFALEEPFGVCACGSVELEWLAGTELNILEVEVAGPCVANAAATNPTKSL